MVASATRVGAYEVRPETLVGAPRNNSHAKSQSSFAPPCARSHAGARVLKILGFVLTARIYGEEPGSTLLRACAGVMSCAAYLEGTKQDSRQPSAVSTDDIRVLLCIRARSRVTHGGHGETPV